MPKTPKAVFIAGDTPLSPMQKNCAYDLLRYVPQDASILTLGRASDLQILTSPKQKIVVFLAGSEKAPARADLAHRVEALFPKTKERIRSMAAKTPELTDPANLAWIQAATAMIRAEEAFVFADPEKFPDILTVYAMHAALALNIPLVVFMNEHLACDRQAAAIFHPPFSRFGPRFDASSEQYVTVSSTSSTPHTITATAVKEKDEPDDAQQSLF